MRIIRRSVQALIAVIPFIAYGQQDVTLELSWSDPSYLSGGDQKVFILEGASYDENLLPHIGYSTPYGQKITGARIKEIVYSPVSSSLVGIQNLGKIDGEVSLQIDHTHFRKQPYSVVSLMPLRRNQWGIIEKADRIVLELDMTKAEWENVTAREKGASSSVLSAGNWHKIGVTSEGIYKISYDYLQSHGIIGGPVSSDALKLYGNGGGMLPEENSKPRRDDLVENAIRMMDGGDGSFGPGDYFLFYGQGPHVWKYDAVSGRYRHSHNLYSDTTCYFITVQGSGGLRIGSRPDGGSATYTSTGSDGYAYNEEDLINVIHSGREFMGNYFNTGFSGQYSYSFSLEDIQGSEPVYIRSRVAARCVSCPTIVQVRLNGAPVNIHKPAPASPSYTSAYCTTNLKDSTFTAPSQNITLDVVRTTGQEAWVDYIELNYRRSLNFGGAPLFFRDKNAIGQGVTEFTVQGTTAGTEIWDITDPLAPVIQQGSYSGGATTFRVSTDSLMQFVALEGSVFAAPSYIGLVPNQDLHALTEQTSTDFIIISHPTFLPAAQELADFHLEHDGLLTHVVTTNQVYNEFSSGSQDVSALRDFVKMYYDKAGPGAGPRYLLLLGDGSFDYKTYLNRVHNETGDLVPNTNFVPAFETTESFDRSGNSYASDDFFALLDNNEGVHGRIALSAASNIDIGVGRLPVGTLEEALELVKKIRHYEEASECMRDWRNVVTVVADDMEDSWESSFFSGSQIIATQMETKYPVWNLDKLYLDSYQQINNAGQRYPDGNQAMNDRANRGSLLINYIGHGGELGWTSERLLGLADIVDWNNYNTLPAFLTATCTFARFDNPAFQSAGETLVLMPDRGGIGLFGTVRAISVIPTFNRKFFDAAFSRLPSGEMPRMGDIIMLSKQPNPTNDYGEWNVLLFGDPALRLAYPEFEVVTDSINGSGIDTTVSAVDTMAASQIITISGHVRDHDGNPLTGFNGVLYTTIFDKPSQLTTLANDPAAVPFAFQLRKNIIFKGKTAVENGYFRFSFQVPLDINYLVGQGKISYYAENKSVDAHGYFTDFAVGGSEDNCQDDGQGPAISVFMNDSNFVSMGITGPDPVLLVHVSDPSGINTVGNGIGHDITAVVDGDQANLIRLNEYYEADIDSYRSGKVRYRLNGLDAGVHTVKVQVWDGCNNVSEKELSFAVTNNNIAVINVYNYPNPFMDQTVISFEHNRAEEEVDTEIMISDINGKIVRTMQLHYEASGNHEVNISWDGKDQSGHRMGAGIYLCRVRMTDSGGEVAGGSCKLVLIK